MFSQLLKWSNQNYAHLPWRINRTLYRTLVSEIMLQQTTVGAVLAKYEPFFNLFPDLKKLAMASEQELQMAWKGLGYYRRARNLKQACAYIHNELQGEIPLDYQHLLAIPGIGPYTASAILSIGANRPYLAIDANVERVLARFFAIKLPKGKALHSKLQDEYVAQLGGDFQKSPRQFNEALMDVGRIFCQARKANCLLCPLRVNCQAAQQQNALEYPVEASKKVAQFEELKLLRLIVINSKGQVLAFQKQKGQWLEGQFELPTFMLSCSDKKNQQYIQFPQKMNYKTLPMLKTGITKYNIENYWQQMSQTEFRPYQKQHKFEWIEMDGNLSTASLKILKAWKKNREEV
jgi:A/G-specific adenine glycosylase